MPATSSAGPRTSSTSRAWAWTTAVAGARPWWGPGRSPDSGRPVLSDAVEGAESPDQVGAVDPDHVPTREERPQRSEGLLVARRVVGREQHDAVGDVEIGVARRQPLPVVAEGARHRQRDHPKRPA